MDNLSTEVELELRSAVKEKIIELGIRWGFTGYIDDELPEYVRDYAMIMVANKRSKQHMTKDLNLFLNEKTGEYVNWLHQVLQKLQETCSDSSCDKDQNKEDNSEDLPCSSWAYLTFINIYELRSHNTQMPLFHRERVNKLPYVAS